METTILYWAYIGIMEKKMEATILCWGYIGIMEKPKLGVRFRFSVSVLQVVNGV